MANKAKSLWLYVKLGKTWRYCKPVWSRNGKELLNTNWSENATPMVPEEEGEAIPPIVNS